MFKGLLGRYRVAWPSKILTVRSCAAYSSLTASQQDILAAQLQFRTAGVSSSPIRRAEVYDRIRAAGVGLKEAEWSCYIISTLAPHSLQLADCLFAAEALCAHGRLDLLKQTLGSLAQVDTYLWEETLRFLFFGRPSSGVRGGAPLLLPTLVQLELVMAAATVLRTELSAGINRYAQPFLFSIVQAVLIRTESEELLRALDGVFAANPVGASALASALLRCRVESVVSESRPQNPGEQPSNAVGAAHADTGLWEWKLEHQIAVGADLATVMIHLVHDRESARALSIYDSCPQLHSSAQFEALYLAAAGAGDYTRLQLIFEDVERNAAAASEGAETQRYESVIRALAFLGQENLLKGIFTELLEKHPEKLSRGVFHALIFSCAVVGNLKSATEAYDMMTARGIAPTPATFNLVLRAYRDNLDISAALAFLGDEMLAKHALRLRNSEVSLLLSMCAARRDYKMADAIWEWAGKLTRLNDVSHAVYLQCHADCNRIDRAQEILDEIIRGGMLRIDNLTVMLRAAGRFPSRNNVLINELIEMAERESLPQDEKWFSAVLRTCVELNDDKKFFVALKRMKELGIAMQSVHYGYLVELFKNRRMFEKCEQVMTEASKRNIHFEFPLIAQFLHALCAPQASISSHQRAVETVQGLLKTGHFDPYSSLVPRSAVPVYVVEPVIRKLIKREQFALASKLLDSMRKQRANKPHQPRDMYMLWALGMEVAHGAKDMQTVSELWQRFLQDITVAFSLYIPASEDRAPVYRLPARYRKNFWKIVSIRIEQLAHDGLCDELLNFPQAARRIGLQLVDKNLNVYIVALLQVGEYRRGFVLARKVYHARKAAGDQFKLSTSAKLALAKACADKKVNYRDYGEFGSFINIHAKQL